MNEEKFDFEGETDMALLTGEADDEESPEEEVVEGQEEDAVEEEAAEEPEVAEEKTNKRDPVIPRARFDEVHSKWQQERDYRVKLEAELEAFRNPKEQQATVDLDALEEQAMNAFIEGDSDTHKQLRRQINAEIRRQAAEDAESRLDQKESAKAQQALQAEQARQMEKLQEVVPKVVEQYPWLDSVSGSGDQEAIADVMALRDTYASRGASLADALLKAVSVIAKARGEQTKPVVTDGRKQMALVAGAKVSNSQPPRLDVGTGTRSTSANSTILDSQDLWEKADKAERLRALS